MDRRARAEWLLHMIKVYHVRQCGQCDGGGGIDRGGWVGHHTINLLIALVFLLMLQAYLHSVHRRAAQQRTSIAITLSCDFFLTESSHCNATEHPK
jgi:hypothetical protein